jgi:hypothetical protein
MSSDKEQVLLSKLLTRFSSVGIDGSKCADMKTLVEMLSHVPPNVSEARDAVIKDDEVMEAIAEEATCNDDEWIATILSSLSNATSVRSKISDIARKRLEAKTCFLDILEVCSIFPSWIREEMLPVVQGALENCAAVDYDDGAILGVRFGSADVLMDDAHDRMNAFLTKNAKQDSALCLFNCWNRCRSGWKKRTDSEKWLNDLHQ